MALEARAEKHSGGESRGDSDKLGLKPSIEPPRIHALQGMVEKLAERVADVHSRLESHEARVSSLEDAFVQLSLEAGRAVKSLDEFTRIAGLIGLWKMNTCRFNRGGVCVLWRLSREAAEKAGLEYIEEDGELRPRVSKKPLLCALCPLYQPA